MCVGDIPMAPLIPTPPQMPKPRTSLEGPKARRAARRLTAGVIDDKAEKVVDRRRAFMSVDHCKAGGLRRKFASVDACFHLAGFAMIEATSLKESKAHLSEKRPSFGLKLRKADYKCITKIAKVGDFSLADNLACLYDLRADFLPAMRLARRRADGLEVLVKKTEKAAFASEVQEEKAWRRNTEMLLNMSQSSRIEKLYDAFEDDEAYYVVMEKVDGCDLFETLHSEVRLTVEDSKAILYRLLQAVQDLHGNGCIHKDLKLENVMMHAPELAERNPWSQPGPEDSIVSTAVVKIVDLDTVEPYSPSSISKHVVGTDQYIAPEAYAGRYSPASDMFSVGVIAYKLISGKYPYEALKFEAAASDRPGSPKMKRVQESIAKFEVNFERYPWSAHPKAAELVRSMLQIDEKSRPTAEQALSHPFFESAKRHSRKL